MEAPLNALQNPGRADDGCGDGKKMRADSPAIVDYVCILKSCKRDWEEKTGDGFMGVKGLGTTDQKRIGIGMRPRKRSPGQDWLVGELGWEKGEKLSTGGMESVMPTKGHKVKFVWKKSLRMEVGRVPGPSG
jgi:hypothetical protein